ncbi:hypothetical protein J4G48_0015805 [Bradyrhizobium barranii subsp. apii]|uniref:hypothetical protein n=1 Tax=Bradyrhizobium barranii TaxID=2992140 RepID=UPI001AA1BA37|nr:hypothetical protein [Bradyrhizobium barranii]UPT99420.1 hypothetical protein J4G48_0015805 [Bradyrhizobium barranii subsp. apii]
MKTAFRNLFHLRFRAQSQAQSHRERVQIRKSQDHLSRASRCGRQRLERAEPPSKHLSSRCRRRYLPFNFVELCTGGLEIGLSRRHAGHCAFMRLDRGCHGGLSGGKSLASFAGHEMLSPLLPCIGRDRFYGFPGGNCTS